MSIDRQVQEAYNLGYKHGTEHGGVGGLILGMLIMGFICCLTVVVCSGH